MAPSRVQVTLHNLRNSDGSALYVSTNGTHTLQSSVHYPLEVPYRSDELPTNTYIEVSMRPHNGVAMVKDRYIEEVVQKVLEHIVLGEETPRCMLQTTIQVMEMEIDEELSGGVKGGGQGEGYLDLLVGAVNSAVLGCLDGGVQMKGLAGAVLVGITNNGETRLCPNVRDRKSCASLHAMGFDSTGQCILVESQGSFSLEDWELAEQQARSTVCRKTLTGQQANGDIAMHGNDGELLCLFDMMRQSVEEKIARDNRWKL